ncbi:Benzoate-CoA ligase OS=Castellaniella defragrans OX=75697 GN=HNR28_001291 PE=4 SV=1 [Castellaniella defragrans]
MATCPEHLNFAQYLFELNAGRAAKTAYLDGERTLS